MADITTLSIDVELAPCPRCSNKLRRRLMRAVYALLIANGALVLILDVTALLEHRSSNAESGGGEEQERGCVFGNLEQREQEGSQGAKQAGHLRDVKAGLIFAEQRHSESPAAATLSPGSMAELPGAFNGAGQGGLS